MGHTLLMEDGMPKITPLKTRIDAKLLPFFMWNIHNTNVVGNLMKGWHS